MISQQLKSGTSGRREVEKRTCEEEKRIGHNTHGEAVSLLFMSGPRDSAAGKWQGCLTHYIQVKTTPRQKLNLTPIMMLANIAHCASPQSLLLSIPQSFLLVLDP